MTTYIKDKSDKYFVNVVLFILILNALKPWIDYGITGYYQVITSIQFVLLSIYITVLNKRFYLRVGALSSLLIILTVTRFVIESIFDVLDGDITAMISTLYFMIRVFLIVYLIQTLFYEARSDALFEKIRYFLLSYFTLTFVYCLMQSPLVFNIDWMRGTGGNIVSGNALGFFRSNGGIGGTVVDYSNFLLAITWLILFTKHSSRNIKYIFLIVVGVCAFMNFSRSLFLSFFVMLAIHLLAIDNYKRFFIAALFVGIMGFFMLVYFDDILGVYSTWASTSDVKRIGSWYSLFEDFAVLDYFVGKDLGGNTGYYLSGPGKISGDGFITGFIYDAGIVMLILLLCLVFLRIYYIPCNLRIRLSIMTSMMIMLVANSGFEKLFLVMTYILSISIISNTYVSSITTRNDVLK